MKKMTPVEVRNALVKASGVGPIDMPAEHYHGMEDFYSHSVLKRIKDSPSKFRWDVDHPRGPTPAMLLGTAIHAALLEPDVFEAKYRVRRDKPKEPERPAELADVTRRSAEGKAKLDAWEATWRPKYDADLATWERERAESAMLSQDDMDTVLRVHARATDDEFLSQFLIGWRESSFFARDAESGMLLRCRCDNVIDDGRFIVDLKTTDCAAPHAFKGDIWKYGYLTQGAFYMDVVAQATGRRPEAFVILAVEKSRDCDMQAYSFSDKALAAGRLIYRSWLTRMAQCLKTQEWPGYAREFIEYDTPAWLDAAIEAGEFSA